jgi:hypothetical protein
LYFLVATKNFKHTTYSSSWTDLVSRILSADSAKWCFYFLHGGNPGPGPLHRICHQWEERKLREGKNYILVLNLEHRWNIITLTAVIYAFEF